MDLALTIFRIGVGLGVLLVGIGLIVAVVSLRPLVRDTRSLARDVQRLARLAEEQVPELLAQARTVAANAEVLTEDVAVRLEQSRLEADLPAARPAGVPVQSGDTGEDHRIA
ncbi:MAG TPA: hypothetical protein VHK63_09115 [Candidatus Limnocylindria bacterium]|nr:hypothetical protein [Candidatus Limnocylindria bacterium]